MATYRTQVYLQTQYSTYNINSVDDNSDVLFYFNEPIIRPIGYDLSMRIVNFVFPVSMYLVDSNNDLLKVDGTSYTLIHGNYTAKTLATHILTLLPSNYSMEYNSITNKYTISYTSNFTINSSSTCLTLLGFTEGTNHTSSSYTLTSDNVVNLSGQYNVIYVDIKNISTSNLSSETGRRTSIVASIPVTVPYGSVMYYSDNAFMTLNLQEDTVQYLHVRILAEDMTSLVSFQSQQWNMTLEFTLTPNAERRNFLDYLR